MKQKYITSIIASIFILACSGSKFETAEDIAENINPAEENNFDAGNNSIPTENIDSGNIESPDSGGMIFADSGQTTSPPVCDPKDCVEAAYELSGSVQNHACETIDDGCGGTIDCGECGENEICGGSGIDPVLGERPGIPNICGGGCIKLETGGCGLDIPFSYLCTNYYNENNYLDPSCMFMSWIGNLSGWCCSALVLE